MKIIITITIAAVFFISGCAGTTANVETNKADCPDDITKFIPDEATSEFVKSCMGEPNNDNYNPDGRYIYFYYAPKGIVLAYLFGPNDKFIKLNAYEDKLRK
jgi:PBP1b-binding outer membrane lipoprotein LpoB